MSADAAVFVSYARQDNDDDALRAVERRLAELGDLYIDDLQDHRGHDRLATVERALESARLFVAVLSTAYLTTTWTRREFEFAVRRGIPILALRTDGTLAPRTSLPGVLSAG